MTWRRWLAAAAVLMLFTACTHGGSKTAKKSATARSGAPALDLSAGVPTGLKLGLIVSSSGPGGDVRDLAAGAYVAAFRLNGAKAGSDHVSLVVVDDNGTPEGASTAMRDLGSQGVVGVVYASTGDHVLAGAATAAELGLPVVFPYADDSRVVAQGSTSFLGAPTIEQVAKELASHVDKSGFTKVAVLRQAGGYGDAGHAALTAAGIGATFDRAFNVGDPLADVAKAVRAANPDAIVIWAEAGPALAATDALSVAGARAPLLYGDRTAVPAFGQGLASALAASAGDGVISAGLWAGPDLPTAAADAFFLARDRAVSDGAITANLALADFRSHDAVLALVAAASASKSTTAAAVVDSLRTVKGDTVKGTAGVPLSYTSATAVGDSDVALLTFSTIDDGSGRYPATATAGGHWLAVSGTYSLPEALSGLDDPYGG